MLIPTLTRPSSPSGEEKAKPEARAPQYAFARTSRRVSATAPHCKMTFTPRLRPMRSTSGRRHAMGATTTLVPPAMFRRMSLALRTWTNTVPGAILPSTETFGCRAALMSDGRLTVTVTGSGWRPGDGPGLKTSPGDTLPSTTAAGGLTTTIGDGRLDRFMFARIMRQHWSPSLAVRAGVWTSVSVLAADTAGARWGLANRLSPGMARAAVISTR